MLDWVNGNERLSPSQLEWVERRFRDLELDADDGSANLWSSGKVPRGVADKTARQLETGKVKIGGKEFALSKPTRPPGRS
jgi:hypothetical protein